MAENMKMEPIVKTLWNFSKKHGPCQKTHGQEKNGHAKKNTWAKGMAMLKTHGLMACHVNFNKRAVDVILKERTVFGAVSGDLGRFWENSWSF